MHSVSSQGSAANSTVCPQCCQTEAISHPFTKQYIDHYQVDCRFNRFKMIWTCITSVYRESTSAPSFASHLLNYVQPIDTSRHIQGTQAPLCSGQSNTGWGSCSLGAVVPRGYEAWFMDGGVDFTFFPTLLTPFHLITWGWTGVGLCDYVRPGQSTRPVSIIICTELALLWYILVYKNTRSACTTQKPHPCRKQQNAGLWATVPFQFLSYLSLQQKWRDRTWRASWLFCRLVAKQVIWRKA